MVLDLVNIVNKVQNGSEQTEILPVDIKNNKEIILRIVINYINHSLQLTDVKSLSWILSEKDKILSLTLAFQMLCMYKDNQETVGDFLLYDKVDIDEPLHKLNVSNIAIEALLKLCFSKTLTGQIIEFEDLSNLLKIAFALVLLQIAAKVIYEKHSYKISDPSTKLKFEDLISVIKNQDVSLTINGQSIDLNTRFIEGSLSFLRKITAAVIIFIGIKEAENQNHTRLLKKLENKNFGCDSNKEFFMLMNMMGWLEDETSEYNFYKIIEQVEEIKEIKNIWTKQFMIYFNDNCGLNDLEVDFEEQKQDIEEQKIDPNQETPSSSLIKHDSNMIPEVLYLTTPDFYFKLPELPKSLENLTKLYYKKKCKLCNNISKRGAICLMCNDYFCVASWNRDLKYKDYEIGTLSAHSLKWGSGNMVFIGPVEGQLIYLHKGLAVEAKSPYLNKYGESYDEKDKKYDTFELEMDHYKKVRELFMNFEIPNFVMTKRSTLVRVYRQNTL